MSSPQQGFNSRLLFSILGGAVVVATYVYLIMGRATRQPRPTAGPR